MSMQRRDFLKAGAAGVALAGLAGCASMPGAAPKARVAVVGGGYGGATAAKYIRMLDPSIEVTLIEPNEAFVSCPISNMVLGGFRTMADITTPYAGLAQHGVQGGARHGDRDRRRAQAGAPRARRRGGLRPRDRLAGRRLHVGGAARRWASPEAQAQVLHAWKAGPQTAQLRRQLEAMPDGGVYVLSVPAGALSLPAGPLRARLPGRGLLQGGQAALQGAAARRERRRDLQGAALQEGLGGPLPGHHRVPRATARRSTSTGAAAR